MDKENMNSMKKKALAFAAAACAFGMLLSGCGSSNGDSTADKGSNVITAYNSEPQNPLIPGDCNETGGGKPLDLLFARLISFDAKGNASNEVAESIKSNDDATQYTIKLKDGWKFTDGTPVTAESFTKAWSYTANAKNAQLGSSFFSTIKGYDKLQDGDKLKGDEQLEGLKVVNDHEFTVDLNRSDSVFAIKVGYTAFAPLPESFFKDPKAFGEKPVGNGPYKFQSWDHDNQIVLVKNPDYKGNRVAKNDGVTFKVYTKDEAAYADIQSGSLDVMESVPASATKTFQKDSTVQAYNKAGSVIQQFTIPAKLKHFEADTEEGTLRRQAVSMAINRENICKKVLNGTGTPAADFTSPLTPGYSDSLTGSGNLKYNEKKAKELWAKANAISPWTSDDKLTFAYNADGGHEVIYTAVVNSINNVLGAGVAATNPYPTFNDFRTAVSDRKVNGAFRSGWQPDYPSGAELRLRRCRWQRLQRWRLQEPGVRCAVRQGRCLQVRRRRQQAVPAGTGSAAQRPAGRSAVLRQCLWCGLDRCLRLRDELAEPAGLREHDQVRQVSRSLILIS